MNLVQVSKFIPIYINMDYILTVYNPKDTTEYYVTTIDGKSYQVNKEVYNIILKYGKAEV